MVVGGALSVVSSIGSSVVCAVLFGSVRVDALPGESQGLPVPHEGSQTAARHIFSCRGLVIGGPQRT